MANIYSVTIEWAWDDSEQGAYSWSGWAMNEIEAEAQARSAMAEHYEDIYDLEDEESGPIGGNVILLAEGANIFKAPEAAARLEKMIAENDHDTNLTSYLQEVLDILRPESS